MRRLVVALALTAVVSLIALGGPATAVKKHAQYEVVLVYTSDQLVVNNCLLKAPPTGYQEENENPEGLAASEVVSTKLYGTKSKAKKSLKHAPQCPGGSMHASIEKEE